MLTIFLFGLALAAYVVYQLLAPEMVKVEIPQEKKNGNLDSVKIEKTDDSDALILTHLLAEKNREITRLQMEIKILQTQAKGSEVMKNILDEEIQHLREQNRMFRSELGLPTQAIKENQIS